MKKTKNKIKTYFYIVFITIFFSIFLLSYLILDNLNKDINSRKNKFHTTRPEKKDFYDDVFSFPKKKLDLDQKIVVGGIIPHHLLAGDLIAEFFSNLENLNFDTVILLGPDHFNTTKSNITTSGYDWKTPFGILEVDRDLLGEVIKFSNVKIEEDIFIEEHSIYSHTGFIKRTFPNARFLPLVLNHKINSKEAEDFSNYLYRATKNKNVLVLASVDFSHYKNNKQAQINDKESIRVIRDFNYQEIYNIDIDSPPSIYTLLKFSELSQADFKLLNNSNSAILSNNLDVEETTSYVTGFFTRDKDINNLPFNNDEEIRMLFFGDMMLDRHVGEKIKDKGLDYIFTNLKKDNFFANYNLIGCNLEGAVTDLGAHYSPIMSYDFAFHPDLIQELKAKS